jgi:glutathione reductase (NADPH)
VAQRCRAAGWSVAIVDSRPFGGTCALRGCDPKKVLVGGAEVVDRVRRMDGNGVSGGVGIDWPRLMAFKRTFTDPVPEDRMRRFREAGIATFRGTARFVGPTAVRVGEDTLAGERIVIATGAKPREFAFPGNERLVTSDAFLELEDLPERIAFLGGGFISFEFAHVAARAGVREIRILQSRSRPLAGFDPDLVDLLVESGSDHGVRLETDAEVRSIEQAVGPLRVRFGRKGDEESLETDMVVHGGGRVPDLDDLDLDTGNVEREARGVKVHGTLRSVSNPAVYAAGDAAATDGLPLTPVATREGIVVTKNLLENAGATPDYAGTPSVVFTEPPLAGVGLQEVEARERGIALRVHHEETTDWNSSRRIGGVRSAFKVLIDEATDRIVGAHLLGPHAEEAINVFGLAIRLGVTASDLKRTSWAYPTACSDISYMV